MTPNCYGSQYTAQWLNLDLGNNHAIVDHSIPCRLSTEYFNELIRVRVLEFLRGLCSGLCGVCTVRANTYVCGFRINTWNSTVSGSSGDRNCEFIKYTRRITLTLGHYLLDFQDPLYGSVTG